MPRDLFVLTNNPMVRDIWASELDIDYRPDLSFRQVLIAARDLVYAGHRLYTHPLAGSVKPNETPYKSVALSRTAGRFDPAEAEIMANAVITADKFPDRGVRLNDRVLEDFRLIDYTLLSGALDLDARAGLCRNHKE